MASDPCKGMLTRFPAGSPERAAQINACTEKKRAARVKTGMKARKTTSTDGTGGPKDGVWKGLADLAKNGLPS